MSSLSLWDTAVVATLNTSRTLLSETRYMPFGGARDAVGTIGETDFGYTGQREIGWMDYNARFYGDGLGRFTQPDTIIPNPAKPQTLNRYSYGMGLEEWPNL